MTSKSGGSNTISGVQVLTDEERQHNQEMIDKMRRYKKYTDEDVDEIQTIIDRTGMKIKSVGTTGTVTFTGKSDNGGEYDVKSTLSFRDETRKGYSQYTFEEVMSAINDTPPLFKDNLNKVTLDGTTGSAKYNGTQLGPGGIKLGKDWLSNNRNDEWNAKSALIHEITHNFDTNGKMAGSITLHYDSLSSSEGFRKLLMEYADSPSTYAGVYTKGPGLNRVPKNERYYTESLSEIMRMVGSNRILPKGESYSRVGNSKRPSQSSYEYDGPHASKVNYEQWARKFPKLAKLGNQLWDATSREEAIEIMNKL